MNIWFLCAALRNRQAEGEEELRAHRAKEQAEYTISPVIVP